MLPFAFAIVGTPVSAQTRNRRRLQAWKDQVRNAARAAWPSGTPPVIGELAVKITYFYELDTPDVDNIIKPIQDALNGVAYTDDRQVVSTQSLKKQLDGAFRVRGVSPELAVHLAAGDDFLWIEVLLPPAPENLR